MTIDTINRTPEDVPAPEPTRRQRLQHSLWVQVAAVGVIVAVLVSVGIALWPAGSSSDNPNRTVPVSAAMEQQLGVRISRVAVVADGGLVTVFYVVLDSEKAFRFQNDTTHRPVLRSESRKATTQKVALMKQGHQLRAGQTYYLVYDNPDVLRPGEEVTITYGGLQLKHVPVL